jgi:folate-dependent phosphoribosylglycinamide formyltransferase PurN
MAKIVVMTGHKHRLVSQVLLKLFLLDGHELDSVIIENRRKTIKQVINRFALKGLNYSIYIFLKTALHFFFGKYFMEDLFPLDSAIKYTKINQYNVVDHNSDKCIDILNRISPDIIVFAGCRLIRSEVFSIANIACINIHGHDIEKVRGSGYPGFWENINDDDEFGITIHMVTEELDQGDILYRKLYPLQVTNLKTIDSVFYEEAPVCLVNGIKNLLDSSFIPEKQDLYAGNYFTQPNKNDFYNFKQKTGRKPY